MTFAQALVRIEELTKLDVRSMDMDKLQELTYLLHDHADSIVQLGKVAERVKNCCVEIRDQHYTSLGNDLCLKTDWALNDFDKLMKEK